MTHPIIEFMLAPDASAARRLRRELASMSARSGVVVGTWRELLELALGACPPRTSESDWSGAPEAALATIDDAFWSRSFSVAPDETTTAVAAAYIELREALALAPLPRVKGLSGRVAARYADFRRLEAALGDTLPADLAAMRHVLATAPTDFLRAIRVSHVDGYPELGALECRVLDHLGAGCGNSVGAVGSTALAHIATDAGRAPARSALGRLQRDLFAAPAKRGTPDATLQWLGCRDALEEIEIAAGMVQRLLAEGVAASAAEIALLVPDDYVYSLALVDVFTRAGLPLAGLSVGRWRRDFGRDVVLQFLHCRQKPAPAMAISACLTSPLMPWDTADGAALAQRVMEGDYALAPLHGFDARARAMLTLLGAGDERPLTLAGALRDLAQALCAPPGLETHLDQAHAVIALLLETLANTRALDWRDLRRRVAPRYLPAVEATEYSLEGVTVWREDQEPWRTARHLLVLGYTAGHYPQRAGTSPVFTDDEKAALAAALGVALPGSEDVLARRRARLRRQLGAVSDSVSFLAPRRAIDGQAARLPDCHVFMADLLGCQDDAGVLVMDVDDPGQRTQLRYLALAPPAHAVPPRGPVLEDLDLGRDLIALRTRADGTPRPESPSGLETLMVSPLAWLLRRLDAQPVGWQPERSDAQLLGQLAHAVFEDLFRAGQPLPPRNGLDRQIARLLETRIAELAPFLRAAQWQVERRNLAGSLARAAAAWRDKLEALGAEILGGELWLAGRFRDIDVHGQADLLLGLPDDRLLVVDYKRSSSKARRQRMANGYDCQASLYRTMIEHGGPKADDGLAARLAAAPGIGVVYYLLNDEVALTDIAVDGAERIPNWYRVGEDVASGAIRLIERRLAAVRAGRVALNGIDDESWFEKTAAVKACYALDVSPLVRLHQRDGLAEDLS